MNKPAVFPLASGGLVEGQRCVEVGVVGELIIPLSKVVELKHSTREKGCKEGWKCFESGGEVNITIKDVDGRNGS